MISRETLTDSLMQLCCDSTEALSKCHWTDCDKNCGSDESWLTSRRNDGKGSELSFFNFTVPTLD